MPRSSIPLREWPALLAPLALACGVLLGGCSEPIKIGGRMPSRVPRTVVSLSPSTTEIVAMDGQPDQLVGRTSSDNYPVFVNNPKIPVYASVKPDYEKLAKDKPDLVVFDGSLYSEQDKAKLKELGLQTYEFKAKTVAEFEQQLCELGATLNAAMNFSQYIDKIERAITSSRASAPQPALKVAALTGGTTGSHLIAGAKGFLADVIRSDGGEPAGPDAQVFVELNPEMLIHDDPDLILLGVEIKGSDTSKAKASLDAFLADARFKSLKAVKNAHVYAIDEDVLVRMGGRVDKLADAVGKAIQASK